MPGISEAMSKMSSGNRSGGISQRMEHSEPEAKPEHGEDGGVHEHLTALHEKMGGKQMHVHAHEGGMTSHHVGEDGKVEGPHEHQNIEELKQHMDQFFNEESHERPSEDEDDGLL